VAGQIVAAVVSVIMDSWQLVESPGPTMQLAITCIGTLLGASIPDSLQRRLCFAQDTSGINSYRKAGFKLKRFQRAREVPFKCEHQRGFRVEDGSDSLLQNLQKRGTYQWFKHGASTQTREWATTVSFSGTTSHSHPSIHPLAMQACPCHGHNCSRCL